MNQRNTFHNTGKELVTFMTSKPSKSILVIEKLIQLTVLLCSQISSKILILDVELKQNSIIKIPVLNIK